MKRIELHASLLTLAVLLVVASNSLSAQTTYDLQIMVNGPWDYVADRHPEYDTQSPVKNQDRIVLVAPAPKMNVGQHAAYIFPGTNAKVTPPNDSKIITSSSNDLALYYVDFESDIRVAGGTPPNEEPAAFYKPTQTVSELTISDALYPPMNATPRFAVSLPWPDFISTYTGINGSGFSESKIKLGPINAKTPPINYSIWTIFHYTTKTSQAQMLLSRLVSLQSVVSVRKVPLVTNDDRAGISIVLVEPDLSANDMKCDNVSGMSFGASMALWSLLEHARFPVQRDADGSQYPGYYDYQNCTEYSRLNGNKVHNDLERIKDFNSEVIEANQSLRQSLLKLLSLSLAPEQREHDLGPARKDAQDKRNDLEKKLQPLWPGGIISPVSKALECTKLLIEGKESTGCPKGLSNLVIEQYFGDGGIVWAKGVGHTDCHKAQININGELQ